MGTKFRPFTTTVTPFPKRPGPRGLEDHGRHNETENIKLRHPKTGVGVHSGHGGRRKTAFIEVTGKFFDTDAKEVETRKGQGEKREEVRGRTGRSRKVTRPSPGSMMASVVGVGPSTHDKTRSATPVGQALRRPDVAHGVVVVVEACVCGRNLEKGYLRNRKFLETPQRRESLRRRAPSKGSVLSLTDDSKAPQPLHLFGQGFTEQRPQSQGAMIPAAAGARSEPLVPLRRERPALCPLPTETPRCPLDTARVT